VSTWNIIPLCDVEVVALVKLVLKSAISLLPNVLPFVHPLTVGDSASYAPLLSSANAKFTTFLDGSDG